MSALVQTRRDGAVAIVTIDNPPVNALSTAVRAALIEELTPLQDDPGVDAVVVACAGRTFIAGADITEFGKPPQGPVTNDVIDAIESFAKPVIAAMHGNAFGGGLEVAQGCHFRVATPKTRLGQPEIKLGIIPGAGGTQRLPRLVGLEKAFAMILTGDPITAEDALASGLVDEIVTGDLVAGAVDFARRVVAQKRPLVLAKHREEKVAAARANPAAIDALAARYIRPGRALDAPAAAVEALRWVFDMPVDVAIQRERAKFRELVMGDQARAQRHIFFAEREAAKVPDLGDVKPREIARAVVIGAGTMGGGIAMCFANAGIPVTVVETSPEALERGLAGVARNYQSSVARGRLAAEERDRRMGLIAGATGSDAVGEADVVIEAVFEDMDVKKRLFADLGRGAKPGAVLATNTSYLDVEEIAAASARPQDVVGMHFFSPANVMRLLEVVRTASSAPAAVATAMALGRKLGKAPVVVGNCHGFVGNRMHRLRSVEAERLLIEGATPAGIDAAMTEFGFPMGPLAASDLAGLDISWRMRKAQGLTAEIADRLCEMGRFGQKTGRGFYLYESGSSKPKPDPEVEALSVEAARRLNVARRTIEPREIVERLIFPMINEGARILDEGIAVRPGDIDVIWVNGYAFPSWRGGPMHYADALGLDYVSARLNEFADRTGDVRHRPTPLLARLVAENRVFASLT